MPTEARRTKILATSLAEIISTANGQEAAMYGFLRDIFCDVLGYARSAVVADIGGQRGRPDITVYAQGGNDAGRVSWIVLEAKDEHGAVADPDRRNALFAEKAKYITVDTAFFVMVDPTMMVMRSVGADPVADVELPLQGASLQEFDTAFAPMRAEEAGVPKLLQAFRDGDEALIARDKLSIPPNETPTPEEALRVSVNRNVFFDTLEETTRLLQQATLRALSLIEPQRAEIQARVDEFADLYGGFNFRPYPISIEGRSVTGREMDAQHRRDAQALRRFLVQNPAVSRLTLDALPRFSERTGLSLEKDLPKLQRFFATETANLILARVLLIRFLEDHGFFDEETDSGRIRRRYLCNGGVHAFQGMKNYFDHGYTRLLEEAYRTGGHLYSSAFDETEMDWIIAMSSPDLSRTLEWSLFRMSRFDFATARGDLMTGVYDRFLDRAQRKEQGEFYTPPSIARYILERLDLPGDATVIDPACGSGTFLIERYRQVYGDIADSGTGNYVEAKQAVERLAGNDLNPFSAVLTQIQLLWHLLAFGDEIKTEGFPDMRVAERANSLLPGFLYDQTQSRFGEIDRSGYDAVVGNPPYVRAERANDLESHAVAYFDGVRTRGEQAFEGVGHNSNAYTLFLYRALDHWCRQADSDDGPPGKVGFIVPLSLCTSKESAAFRKLLEPGGRFAVREIVDLELIWSKIFDADVLPMIVIIESTPAEEDDTVSIRLADDTCVRYEDGSKRPTFAFDHLPEQMIRYGDLFTPDGRMQTRITPERSEILAKLRSNGRLAEAALPYWTRRGRPSRLTAPTGHRSGRWKEDRLIKDGFAKRGKVRHIPSGGYTTYKGENISTSMFTGDPVDTNFDVENTSSASVWANPQILPDTVYAIPVMETVPVAAPFNPHEVAIENTGVVLAPAPEFAEVPFDTLLVSTVYGFFHMVGNRRSFQNKLRNHIYTTAIADLPWNRSLVGVTDELKDAGDRLIRAGLRRYEQTSELEAAIEKLDVTSLRDLVRNVPGARVERNEAFAEENEATIEVGAIVAENPNWSLPISQVGEHALIFNDERVAELARAGLARSAGSILSWQKILDVIVPATKAAVAEMEKLDEAFQPAALEAEIYDAVAAIDAIVGPALGLSDEDIAYIHQQMAEDPFLSRATPRFPHFRPRQYGRRINLERANRYRN